MGFTCCWIYCHHFTAKLLSFRSTSRHVFELEPCKPSPAHSLYANQCPPGSSSHTQHTEQSWYQSSHVTLGGGKACFPKTWNVPFKLEQASVPALTHKTHKNQNSSTTKRRLTLLNYRPHEIHLQAYFNMMISDYWQLSKYLYQLYNFCISGKKGMKYW